MNDIEWVEMELVVATSHPVEAYGGVRLSVTALDQMAEQLNTGGIPLIGHHSHLLTIRTRNGVAEVRQRQDGHHEVHVLVEVAKSDWDRVGNVCGMSFATSSPIGQYGDNVVLKLDADAAWFSDSDIIAAGGRIASALSLSDSSLEPGVEVGRYYQFSILPEAKIVLSFAWSACVVLGPNIVASAIWDGVKSLFLKHRKLEKEHGRSEHHTVIDIRIKKGDLRVEAVVTTVDESVARSAINALPEIIKIMRDQEEKRVVFDWRSEDEEHGSWRAGGEPE